MKGQQLGLWRQNNVFCKVCVNAGFFYYNSQNILQTDNLGILYESQVREIELLPLDEKFAGPLIISLPKHAWHKLEKAQTMRYQQTLSLLIKTKLMLSSYGQNDYAAVFRLDLTAL